MAYHTGDRDRAIEWLTLCAKWNALTKHTLYLLPAFDCVSIPEIVPFVGLTDYLRVSSNWRSADGVTHADASGPNSMFVQFARHFYDKKLGPWFFCESDCIPLKPHSFDKLEEEYIARGKPFMGGYAPAPVPHINGNLIAPEKAALIPTLMLPMKSTDGTRDIAFDVAAAREILPQAHATGLIQHLWRGPSFTSQEDFDSRIRPDALFFHQCRDGSIYQFIEGRDKRESQTTTSPFLDVTRAATQTTNGAAPPDKNSIEAKRARMAAARAVAAENRRLGITPKRKRKKRARRRHAKA